MENDATSNQNHAQSHPATAQLPGENGSDATRRIEQSVLCRDCGYQLMGLHADRHCPECGLAIAFSMQRDALGFAPARWLKKLRIGFVVMIVGAFLHASTNLFQYFPILLNPSWFLTFYFISSGTLMILEAGGWLSTASEPGAMESRIWHPRKLARIGFVIIAIDIVFDLARPTLGFSLSWGVASVVGFLYTIAIVGIAWPAFCIYVSRIARRRPSVGVARQLKVLLAVFAASALMSVVSRTLVLLLVSSTQSYANMPYSFAAWGSFIGFGLQLAAQIWMAILLVILSVHIRRLLTARNHSRSIPNNSAESTTN